MKSIMLGHLPWVALGGAMGATLRYILVALVTEWAGKAFPWGTLFVNVLGSFILGGCFVYIMERLGGHPELRAIIIVGMLGALTTFSTFALEIWGFLEHAQWGLAVLYALSSVVLCVLSVSAGILVARQVFVV
ncbi:fluoride efflux transporter CrcB [Hahella sp. SMD15-11]|uniref:Fluoride-specific ion channel FluC n=1 Tax=Thermohahella caldifontis TaxID=3142973 RepID=A0AB39UX69_9GAMM